MKPYETGMKPGRHSYAWHWGSAGSSWRRLRTADQCHLPHGGKNEEVVGL